MSGQPEALPCGVEPEALVGQAFGTEAASDEQLAHQATCPHCQATLASLRSLRQDMEAVATVPVGVPPDFARRVMARVRGATPELWLSTEPRGTTTVTEALLVRVARVAAMEVPHVTFALAEIGRDGDGDGDGRSLTLRLVVDFGPDLAGVAAAVRARVERRTRRSTGLIVGRIDVVFEDLSD